LRADLKKTTGYLVDVVTRESLEFQYNPDDITDEKSTDFATIKVPGMSHPRYQFVAGEARKISFKLSLFKGPVKRKVAWLQSLLYPQHEKTMLKNAPHKVLFFFGDLYLQERMLLVAAGGKEDVVLRICEKWDLDVAVIGRVTSTGRWRAHWHGKLVADLPVDPLTEGAPRYERPMKPHPALPELNAFDATALPAPKDLGHALLRLLARPTVASKEWVYRQYDHMVRLVAAVRPGGDAAVVRIATGNEPHARKGIAVSVAANSRYCFLDPHLGAMHAVAECARNIACVGGEPIAITDCLNFGNPEKPEIMWQFAECVRGIGDACRALGTPVVSGNVSLYNETEGQGIFPTPTVGMVGLVEPVDRTCHSAFRNAGDVVALVGSIQGEVGGSEYLACEFGKEAGRPPALDLAREKAVQETVRRAIREGLLSSAHDCSDGGLAVALAECCMMADPPADGSAPAWLGAAVRIPFPVRKDFVLFGEDASRIVVSLPNANARRLLELAH
jgi:phosphoribosylformylglycinamidine synthase